MSFVFHVLTHPFFFVTSLLTLGFIAGFYFSYSLQKRDKAWRKDAVKLSAQFNILASKAEALQQDFRIREQIALLSKDEVKELESYNILTAGLQPVVSEMLELIPEARSYISLPTYDNGIGSWFSGNGIGVAQECERISGELMRASAK